VKNESYRGDARETVSSNTIATQLMPNYAASWVQAGEILSELWKLRESAQCYERAIELDETLTESLVPVIERLRKRQELLDIASASS
jgi:tetratricopeptide (TPR) repeat protein